MKKSFYGKSGKRPKLEGQIIITNPTKCHKKTLLPWVKSQGFPFFVLFCPGNPFKRTLKIKRFFIKKSTDSKK